MEMASPMKPVGWPNGPMTVPSGSGKLESAPDFPRLPSRMDEHTLWAIQAVGGAKKKTLFFVLIPTI